MEKDSLVYAKSVDFSLAIIDLYKTLYPEKEWVISKQLLRSGTSLGANISEALSGYSKKDFTYKMSLANKEARETKYWLLLLNHASLAQINMRSQLTQVEELIKILTAIIKTAQTSPS
ncbi:MAG: four helix bundle protein [Sphingobacteriales bacterium]|jgi:four helix bundle protein